MNFGKKFKILYLLLFFFSFFITVRFVYADTSGQKATFFVNSSFDKYKRTSLPATLRYIGGHLYFYIDDGYWNGLSSSRQSQLIDNITALSGEFDVNIYPKETQLWGTEPNPGIDNDPKAVVLVEDLVSNNGGYVDIVNGYSVKQAVNSNQREMLSMNAEVLITDISIAKMFLGHEFQHLISFNQKEKVQNLSEDVWLNEMRSEYSISAVGYNDTYSGSNLERRAYTFTGTPNDSLTEWPNDNKDYATVALFSEYLVQQFGRNILSETLKMPFTGIDSLNRYLERKGYYERFGDVFLGWLGALYLNDVNRNPKLGYQRPVLKTLKVSPQEKIFLSHNLREYSSTKYIKDWQPLWLEYDLNDLSNDQTKSARIDVMGESGQNFIASYLAFYDLPAGQTGTGPVEFGRINVVSGRGSGFVLNSDRKLRKVVVVATKSTKISGFGSSEPENYINIKISIVDNKDVWNLSLKDGALIRRPGEKELYVIWGKYKRYLNPEIIGLYGHLNPANAIELEPVVFDSYTTSNYVKYVGEERVYAIWPDGTKHWLNITPKQWDASNRDWNAIFTINELEVGHYKSGADIIR